MKYFLMFCFQLNCFLLLMSYIFFHKHLARKHESQKNLALHENYLNTPALVGKSVK